MFQILKTAAESIREIEYSTFIKLAIIYIWQNLLCIPIIPYAINKIQNISPDYSVDKLIDYTYKFSYGLIAPVQIRHELLELLKKIDNRKPRHLLEIGTAGGGTLFLFSHVAHKDAIIISIDQPGGRFGGGYSNARIPLYKSFALKNQQIYLIRKNSHNAVTLDEVKNILNNTKVDFLFIDGDHTYQGVKQDFEIYSSLVRKNGIIALHDIVQSNVTGCEVSKFWEEIKYNYDYIEIVKNWNQNWAGIGIIKK